MTANQGRSKIIMTTVPGSVPATVPSMAGSTPVRPSDDEDIDPSLYNSDWQQPQSIIPTARITTATASTATVSEQVVYQDQGRTADSSWKHVHWNRTESSSEEEYDADDDDDDDEDLDGAVVLAATPENHHHDRRRRRTMMRQDEASPLPLSEQQWSPPAPPAAVPISRAWTAGASSASASSSSSSPSFIGFSPSVMRNRTSSYSAATTTNTSTAATASSALSSTSPAASLRARASSAVTSSTISSNPLFWNEAAVAASNNDRDMENADANSDVETHPRRMPTRRRSVKTWCHYCGSKAYSSRALVKASPLVCVSALFVVAVVLTLILPDVPTLSTIRRVRQRVTAASPPPPSALVLVTPPLFSSSLSSLQQNSPQLQLRNTDSDNHVASGFRQPQQQQQHRWAFARPGRDPVLTFRHAEVQLATTTGLQPAGGVAAAAAATVRSLDSDTVAAAAAATTTTLVQMDDDENWKALQQYYHQAAFQQYSALLVFALPWYWHLAILIILFGIAAGREWFTMTHPQQHQHQQHQQQPSLQQGATSAGTACRGMTRHMAHTTVTLPTAPLLPVVMA